MIFSKQSGEALRVALLINALLLVAIASTHLPAQQQAAIADDVFTLTYERLHSPWEGSLNNAGWLYKADKKADDKAGGANDANRAARDYDDRAWEKIRNTQLNVSRLPREGWTGAAWFRLHIKVDERLAHEPVALRLSHLGASEIYLDGNLLRRFGKVSDNSKSGGEVEHNPRAIPVPVTFETGGEHVIAVRYSLAATRDLSKGVGAWLARGGFTPGFSLYIQTAQGAIDDTVSDLRGAGTYKLFNGILYAFALLHFLLFIFYRKERANLYYSLFAFCLATASMFSNIVNNGNQTAVASALIFILFVIGYASAFLALQAFLYEAFAARFSKFFRFSCVMLSALIAYLFVFIRDRTTLYVAIGFFIISLADSLRLVVLAVVGRKEGAWIIAGGVPIFAIGILMFISREFQYLQDSQWYELLSDLAVTVAVPVAVSLYLARNFARTNRHLEAQLVQVKDFAEKEVEHERSAARLLIVEAENDRRAKELDEARQLQLSMLPKKLPQLLNMDIAAYMKPATEVGGDYYDFHVGDDGTLTVAVGDATGHGLKAGTVVTATKSLFNNLADESDIADTLRQISRALKGMNLRGLFMAMTMLKIKDGTLRMSAAGMPSTLIYRAASAEVEEIILRAVPLGSLSNFAYRERELALSHGDCVIVMSDGFPEMFNERMEMLDYDKAKELLGEVAHRSSQEIINRFVEIGEVWAQGRPPDDDVTFVVLKVNGCDGAP